MRSRPILLVGVVLILLFTSLGAGAQSDTFGVVAPWVVAIVQPQPDGKHVSLGTGFVSQGGYVVTAAHVIPSARSPIFLGTQGELTPARMRRAKALRIRRDTDIAVLDGGYLPTDGLLHQQVQAEPGDEVWIFGYEFPGNIAVLRLAHGWIGQKFHDASQIDGAVQPGFSGGPVTSRGGQVVGIVDFGSKANPNLAYIVPDARIRDELAALPARGRQGTGPAPIIPLLGASRLQGPSRLDDTRIVPGRRLGPLELGAHFSSISQILGEPPEGPVGDPPSYLWPKYGIGAATNPQGNVVLLGTVNPEFVAPGGIRVGSPVAAVQVSLGLNYQRMPTQDPSVYWIRFDEGISFAVDGRSHRIVAIFIDRFGAARPSPTLTGTYIGNYTATPQPGIVYQAIFQITQEGTTIVGTVTTTAGRSGRLVGTLSGTRIHATMTFTDACAGSVVAVIDVVDEGRRLVGNYTASDCLGTYSGGFALARQ